jgi:hypothetical protein
LISRFHSGATSGKDGTELVAWVLTMWCLRLAFLLLSCVGCFAAAAAEISCSNVQAIPGPIGYQRRQNAERCEGFYQQQVAGSLELLSLVSGPINYDLVSDKVLTVAVPALPQLQSPQVFLTARALPPGTYYRMDAVIGPSGNFKWPLNEVLAPAKLRSDSIGVVAWINQVLGKYYVPISIAAENVAPSAARLPVMIFRSSLDIELLRWRVRREGGGVSAGDWIKVGGQNPAIIRAGQWVSLQIPAQPSGPSIVDVVANYANTGPPEPQLFRVILP